MDTSKKTIKKKPVAANLLKKLPPVESVLLFKSMQEHMRSFSREFISYTVGKQIDILRGQIVTGGLKSDLTRERLTDHILIGVETELQNLKSGTLIPVINATGIILHTGMGRAPLSPAAARSVRNIITGYSTLEINRRTGQRGKRENRLEQIFCFLSGAEAATVVNNNAAAVFITLNTLAHGKEVIVSRGELVEIGGSFRMPEIVQSSGAIMKEVGTTNKTKISDYEKAITSNTAAILVVHTSNFKVMGFIESVPFQRLAKLAQSKKLPIIYDLGGGALFDLRDFGLPYEPIVAETVKQGADIVTFSGDKVMGGPQSGIIVGKKRFVDAVRENPIARAIRCGKLDLAALEGTMKSYTKGVKGFKALPTMKLMLESPKKVRKKAEALFGQIQNFPKRKLLISIEETFAEAGSGALPLEKIPSYAIVLESSILPPEKIAAFLRTFSPPVFGYIKNDRVFLDMRTVFENQTGSIAKVINRIGQNIQ